jgi:hypothetical protein
MRLKGHKKSLGRENMMMCFPEQALLGKALDVQSGDASFEF